MPGVEGLAEQEARERLLKAGLEVGFRSRTGPEETEGKVLEQSVAGGKEANDGSKILLTVGKGLENAKNSESGRPHLPGGRERAGAG